jgi:hypothetical protein
MWSIKIILSVYMTSVKCTLRLQNFVPMLNVFLYTLPLRYSFSKRTALSYESHNHLRCYGKKESIDSMTLKLKMTISEKRNIFLPHFASFFVVL